MRLRRFFVLISHRLTEDQHRDKINRFGEVEMVTADPALLGIWSAIPPDLERLEDYLYPIRVWLETESRPGDILFVQGEHGATVYGVQLAFALGLVPVYATSRRVVAERVLEDGSVETLREFRHVLFRAYPAGDSR